MQKLQEQEEVAISERELRDTALCAACLREQGIQRKIDDKTHNHRLFESTDQNFGLRFLSTHRTFKTVATHCLCGSADCCKNPDAEWGISKLIFVSRERLTKKKHHARLFEATVHFLCSRGESFS